MKEMIDLWNRLAKENGLNGISFAFQCGDYDWNNSKEADLFDYDIEFQPPYASHWLYSNDGRVIALLKNGEDCLQDGLEKNLGLICTDMVQLGIRR